MSASATASATFNTGFSTTTAREPSALFAHLLTALEVFGEALQMTRAVSESGRVSESQLQKVRTLAAAL